MVRPCAIAEVALDRLIGALGLTMFVVLAGATLPSQLLVAAVAIAAIVLLLAFIAHRRRPDLLTARPLPSMRVTVKGVSLSIGYQMTIIGLLMGPSRQWVVTPPPSLYWVCSALASGGEFPASTAPVPGMGRSSSASRLSASCDRGCRRGRIDRAAGVVARRCCSAVELCHPSIRPSWSLRRLTRRGGWSQIRDVRPSMMVGSLW